MKQVFPLLYRPLARLQVEGHVASMPSGYRDAVLALAEFAEITAAFPGLEGGGGGLGEP